MGPCEAARQAMIDIVPGWPLPDGHGRGLTNTFAKIEGLDPESVAAYAGSSEPLHYTVLTFTDKNRPLVVRIPAMKRRRGPHRLPAHPFSRFRFDPKGEASHNIKAMLAASSNPGVIYICNPTTHGTCTSRTDIEYAVANARKTQFC